MRRLPSLLPLLLLLVSASQFPLRGAGPSAVTVADIVVAADGSGDFRTIGEAIAAVPDYEHSRITTVLIRAGVYEEMVTIPANKCRLHLIGEDAARTVITYGKYAEGRWPVGGTRVGTSGSATMYVHASYVTIENLTIRNTAGSGPDIGQAVALFTNGDCIFVRGCRILGNQDTLYTYGSVGRDGSLVRNYFLDCYIEGTTDFIFGSSACYFQGCEIRSKVDSFITAASTPEGHPYGYVFRECDFTAGEGVAKCYLGRPWGAYARTVVIDCTLGAHILPEGWHDWEKEGKPLTKKNAYYAEYRNHGPGSDTSARVDWSFRLNPYQAEDYTFEAVMHRPSDPRPWDPFDNR